MVGFKSITGFDLHPVYVDVAMVSAETTTYIYEKMTGKKCCTHVLS